MLCAKDARVNSGNQSRPANRANRGRHKGIGVANALRSQLIKVLSDGYGIAKSAHLHTHILGDQQQDIGLGAGSAFQGQPGGHIR